MNRKDRRALAKRARSEGIGEGSVKAYLASIEAGLIDKGFDTGIHDGDYVTLNVDRIRSKMDYPSKTEKYKEFVENNEHTTFVAHQESDVLFFLGDNKTWLFWGDDLLVSKKCE